MRPPPTRFPPWWPSVNRSSAHQCFWEEEFRKPRWEPLDLSLVSVLIEVVKDEIICGQPFLPIVPLFRVNGLRERDGCFYVG